MEAYTTLRARCAALVTVLNTDLGWNLNEVQQSTYVENILQHLSTTPSWLHLRDLIVCYHQDHAFTQSIQNLEHIDHYDCGRNG